MQIAVIREFALLEAKIGQLRALWPFLMTGYPECAHQYSRIFVFISVHNYGNAHLHRLLPAKIQ